MVIKKLFIKIYGCQMNVYDSQCMVEVMGVEGYVLIENQVDVDMVLLNICYICEKVVEKLYFDLGCLKFLKVECLDLKIGVVGCVVQVEGVEIQCCMFIVDLVVGLQVYYCLFVMVCVGGGVDMEFFVEDKFEYLLKFVVICCVFVVFLIVQEGCDKFCVFCVVFYICGVEVS